MNGTHKSKKRENDTPHIYLDVNHGWVWIDGNLADFEAAIQLADFEAAIQFCRWMDEKRELKSC